MKAYGFVSLIVLASALVACTGYSSNPTTSMVGNDRDAHGCIGSAGYSWCAKENKCVRSWELAAEKGFDVNAEAFSHYCDSAAK